jgi:membrane protein implicated in regulation of membrane protease activity
LFILALPVALACWLTLVIFIIVSAVAREVWRPIRQFWSAPQRHRFEYSQYRYFSRSASGSDLAAALRPRASGEEEAMVPAE